MKSFFYHPYWYFKTRFLGQKKPLQTVLFITNECNLECKHCIIYEKENIISKSYAQIREELQYSYDLGSRFVDFEGGEPLLWRENEKNINDLIALAHEIGFFTTTVTTNAQLPIIDLKANSIWISMDGIGELHDAIRGKGAFEKLGKNISESNHPNMHTNMVVNKINYQGIKEAVEWVSAHPKLKSIAINLHTPFPGTEPLMLTPEQRLQVLDEVIQLKKRGAPIMNSVSGLKYMKGEISDKYCFVSNFIQIDGTRTAECSGKIFNLCDSCGCCMSGEMKAVMNLKPDTIIAGLKLRNKKK